MNIRGYRTFIISAAGFVVGVVGFLGPLDAEASIGVITMSVLMAVLRYMTSTPPGRQP